MQQLPLWAATLWLAGVLLSTPASAQSAGQKPAAAARSAAGFAVEPAPAWVRPVPPDPAARVAPAPLSYALLDRQTRLEPGSESRFFHTVSQVNEAAGLEAASQIQIDFDPSYQKLVLHRIEIWRGERRIDKLDRRKIKLLQRETQLERQMVDGRVTASLVLDDLRAGDRVDVAFTLRGSNPAFGGRFIDDDWAIAWRGPVALYQYRLLAPAERAVRSRVGPAGVESRSSVEAGVRETVLRRRSVPQFPYDPYAPEWVFLGERVQFSEFADWADVARWAEGLFAPPAGPSPELKARADAIRAASATPEERLLRALDFVQKDVRYFGTEIGANSHQPAAPEQVLRQRFGDCKDKAALLVALLKALDIDAAPVLVSTGLREHAGDPLPSALNFNHVITRVTLGERVFWLDGTRAYQTGPLAERQSLGLGRGLVARAGATALAELPSGVGDVRISTRDTLRFAQIASDPTLEARITYHGELAEGLRNTLATRPADELDKQLVGEYARSYPSVRSEAPMQVEEEPGHNAVTLVLQMAVPHYWRFPEQKMLAGDFVLQGLMQPLRLPDQAQRKTALRLAEPGLYRHSLVYEFGEDAFTREASDRFDDGDRHFKLGVSTRLSPRRVLLDGELQMLPQDLEPAEWAAYRERLIKLWPRLGSALNVAAIPPVRLERLKADFETLQTAMKKGQVKVVTRQQVDFRVRLLGLTAQLDSGRLSPPLRAEALVARGVVLDHLGRVDDAGTDFAEAQRLDPDSVELHAALAVNALLRRQDADALAQAGTVLQLAPSRSEARLTRAHSNYYLRNYRAARSELSELVSAGQPSGSAGYAAVWLYLSARRAGDEAAAREALQPAAGASGWPYPVLEFFNGQRSVDGLLDAAKDGNRPDPGRVCELYFFAGEKALIDGDVKRAREYFQKSVDTGVVEFTEHALAQRGLDALALR